jgi:hypothetical protein
MPVEITNLHENCKLFLIAPLGIMETVQHPSLPIPNTGCRCIQKQYLHVLKSIIPIKHEVAM